MPFTCTLLCFSEKKKEIKEKIVERKKREERNKEVMNKVVGMGV